MSEQTEVFFSIIIPVYNVENYLEECVTSVLAQDFQDYEIILVDDGSTDGSGRICDKLQRFDSRIHVFHQQNQGLSGARNRGLDLAKGQYVLFLDSDDFYPQNTFLSELRKQSRNSDIVCFNYARYTDHLFSPMLNYPSTVSLDKDSLLLELVKRNTYASSACFKAVKRSLLVDNRIQFELGTISEDVEWSAQILLSAQSISLAPQCLYAYRVRQNSITHTISVKHVYDQCKTIQKLSTISVNGNDLLKEAYYSYTAFQYCTLLINIHLCKPKPARETVGEIKQMAWLLQYDSNRIVKLIHTVYQVLGFTMTSWLLLIYFKIFGK